MARANVDQLFQKALRRHRDSFSHSGPLISDSDGAAVQFSVVVEDGVIASIDYRATTCITLVAVAEAIRDELQGASLERAGALTADTVLEALPGIPPARRSRIDVAVRALQEAL